MDDNDLFNNPYFIFMWHFGSAFIPLAKFVFLRISQIGCDHYYLVQYIMHIWWISLFQAIINSSDIDLKRQKFWVVLWWYIIPFPYLILLVLLPNQFKVPSFETLVLQNETVDTHFCLPTSFWLVSVFWFYSYFYWFTWPFWTFQTSKLLQDH